jgi:AmmeMemoRadiSam system protein B/AmmeMemoRadiSam system protein A
MAQNCESKEYRESRHAGSWYPGDKAELTKMLGGFFAKARTTIHGNVYALISPHAGYVYSGHVAACAYKTVEGTTYDAVIVIGPSHYHGFYGASVDTLAGRTTPLGTVEYDRDLARRLIKKHEHIVYEAAVHRDEHSVELQIPFLQYVFRNPKIVEIVLGSQNYTTCEMLSNAILDATTGMNVLIVASSDLSHFHAQSEAQKLDDVVIESVARFDPQLLHKRLSQDSCEACGGGPIVTAMLIAKQRGAQKAEPLMYATSGDVTGDYSQVVGYLAAAFYTGKETKVGVDLGFTEKEKTTLKNIARASIEAAVKGEKPPEIKDASGKLQEPYGIFVTINKHGSLRGCIGLIISDRPLYRSCQQMAKAAALEDPRFPPVTKKELPDLEIEISILTPPERITDFSDIVIGRDGLIISRGYARGLLLPQVAAEYGWTVEEFLEETCRKAGLPRDAYKQEGSEIQKFSAEVF